MSVQRCAWAMKTPEEMAYHDGEWGVPVHDDVTLFEFLILEGAQAGLSWATILKRRDAYRTAYQGFKPEIVAGFDAVQQFELLQNSGIIRNRAKVAASITNAQAFLKIQEEFGSYDAYLWRFVEGKPIINYHREMRDIPPRTTISDKLSKDLQTRGIKFAGSTICYAMMQAVGMVNDHLVCCPRHAELGG
jgi:DNA-3-methyladenine glycosylase I